MIIRGYNEIDEQGVMDLLEELRGSKESAMFDFYLKDSDTYKKTYLKNRNYIVLVAKIDDKIAGFIIAEHYTNEIVNLVMLYVGLNYRRQGVAFALKSQMEVLARAKGYLEIISQVRTNNYESIALNKKAGWIQELDKIYPDYYYWFKKQLTTCLPVGGLKMNN